MNKGPIRVVLTGMTNHSSRFLWARGLFAAAFLSAAAIAGLTGHGHPGTAQLVNHAKAPNPAHANHSGGLTV